MTTEPHEHDNSDINEFTGQWFDSEPGDSEPGQPLDTKQRQRSADLQLAHSLLLQLSDCDDGAKERRIQDVMQRIRRGGETSAGEPNSMLAKLRCYMRPLVPYGIAAVLIISVVFLITQMPTNSAVAAIDQMIAAIDQAGDRTYSIMVKENRRERRPPQPGRNPGNRRLPGERASLDGATLYLRGGGKFVLYRRTPSGKTVINGSDGQTRWHIRPDKPVLVSNDPEAFRIPMPEELAAILSLDFKATLQHIRKHYEVKYLEDFRDGRQQDRNFKYLDASIEICAEGETGLLMRIEFADIRLQGDPSLKRLIIDLIDQSPLSEDWFSRQAHHAPDAEIDFLYDSSGAP